MIDYRLETFLYLCETMSYTRTAQQLNITQPTVTQHIQYLEKCYGTALFRYEHKSLALTEKGRLLRRYAMSLRANSEQIDKVMRAAGEARDALNFGATLTIGEYIMPPILERYLLEYPETDIFMRVNNTSVLLEALQKGQIDFAIVEGNFDRQEYDSLVLSEEPFIGICAAHSPLVREPVTLAELTGERLILRERGSGTRNVLETVLLAHNLNTCQFHGLMEISNFQAIQEMVRAGFGISFLYREAARNALDEGRVARINLKNFQVSREFCFVFLRGSVSEKRIRDFFTFCAHVRRERQSVMAAE